MRHFLCKSININKVPFSLSKLQKSKFFLCHFVINGELFKMEENNIFQNNWDKFFKNGKTVILPIDHGTVIPVTELNDTGQLIEDVTLCRWICSQLWWYR